MEKVEEVLTILDEAGIRLKLEKCKKAQTKTEWLGFKLSESGVKPIDENAGYIGQTTTENNQVTLLTTGSTKSNE